MGQAQEYFSNILAKIQHLQDLYSKHYQLSITLYDQEGKRFGVPSYYSLLCGQTCTEDEICQNFIDKLLRQAKRQSSSVVAACPFGLSVAVIPLGLCLEANTTSPADYYLVVGKIKLSNNDGRFFSEEPQSPVSCKGDMSLEEFTEITQLIAFNMDMIFSLLKLGGISLQKKQQIKKEDYAQLTQREKEILHLVSNGMSNQEIANALFISDHTVKVHISNILRKLQMNNRTKLALYKTQVL